MTTGASNGFVLKSDAAGNATWVNPNTLTIIPNKLQDADANTKIQVEKNTNEDIIRFDMAGTERLVLTGAKIEPKNNGQSVFLGELAGANEDLSNNQNVFLGYAAGQNITAGSHNIAIGHSALATTETTNNNIAIGHLALNKNVGGVDNTALGTSAGYNNMGSGNVFLGYNAGANETGNDKLYIDNTNTATPLIQGDFAANTLKINGAFQATQDAKINGKISINTPIMGSLGNDLAYPRLEMRSNSSDSSDFNMTLFENSGFSPWINIAHARGSSTTPSILQDGDGLFAINAQGYNGTEFKDLGGIDMKINGSVSPTSMPTEMNFTTTPVGSSSSQTQMTITSSGNVGIGISNPTNKLEVVGTTKTTNLQMTTGANNGYVLQSDAAGNATWVNPTTIATPETDPKVGSLTNNYTPHWNGTSLANGKIIDDGAHVGIGMTPSNNLDVKMGVSSTTTLEIDQDNGGGFGTTHVAAWQTFTATTNGSLNKIGLKIYVPNADTRTVKIYDGEGTSGTLLYTCATVTVIAGTSYWLDFPVSGVSLIAGNKYTIDIDDSYHILLNTNDVYAGGRLSVNPTYDFRFRVYMQNNASFSVSNTGVTVNNYMLPTADGAANYILQTNGAGLTSWANPNGLITVAESDPKVGSLTTNYYPKWNGTTLANGQLYDNGTQVTIGTTSLTQAKFIVNGNTSSSGNYGYLNSSGSTGTVSSGAGNYSIYAVARVAASEFNAFSDKRIKNVIGVSNQEHDLELLSKIKITDYKMIDTIAKGNQIHKKVIAQEVATILPSAVNKTTEFIPNIYKTAAIDKDGFIALENHKLIVGDKVKLFFDTKEEIVEVKNSNEKGFYVNYRPSFGEAGGRLFVFGKLVNDFHTVDYEALSTLNISATQALLKRLNDAEAKVKAQENRLDEQASRLTKLEAIIFKTTAEH
ncbi:MAG: hypothetical protein RI894_2675, partial [Bacteroidota bacterium]